MRYRIADIVAEMNIKEPRLLRQSEEYIYTGDAPTNVSITLSEEYYAARREDFPEVDDDLLEYMFMGYEFYNALIHYNGLMLHSSCVVYNDRAYLFSAPCGTGKSTHTQIWLKRFPGAYILNDDKPAIRITPDGVYAYGTPFSGKTDLNVNKGVKIGGICVIGRDTTNHIEKITAEEALFNILNQTARPYQEEIMDKLLTTLDTVLREVPCYRLYCNMELEAAEVAYEEMREK